MINEFGKGFSVDNLQNMSKLYLTYSISETMSSISKEGNQKYETVSSVFKNESLKETSKPTLNFRLTWSRYIFLMSIEEVKERKFY